MSREIDMTIALSREEWLAIEPQVEALLRGARQEALRTSVDGILSTLVDYPEARAKFMELLNNTLPTAVSNDLMEFITMAQRKASERALWRGTRLLEGGYAEWEKLDEEGSFWSWCYQGCNHIQKEEVAKALGQRLHFGDGSTWRDTYVKGNVPAPALLEDLFEEIVLQSVRYSSVLKINTNLHEHRRLNEALLKSQRRTHFLDMLARAHGNTQRSPLPREGAPLNCASFAGSVMSPDNDQLVADSTAAAHSQEEEVKRRMSLDNESKMSSKRPKVAECRDYSGGSPRSLSQSEHQEDQTQQVGRAGTPHPRKRTDIDRVSRPKRCKQVVDWLRRLSRQFTTSLIHPMPCLKRLGKKTTPEPPEFELEDCRKHSSQSRSTGFRGGAGLNLRKRRKTGSPAALSATTKDFLHVASEPTATSRLDVGNELPHSTLDSTAPLHSRTNKCSPHSILEQATLSDSSSSKDSPHSLPGSVTRPKPHKTQDYVDGGDREF